MIAYNHTKKIALIAMFSIVIIGLSAYFFTRTCEGIVPYKPSRDKEFLLKLFADNWYWLVPEHSKFSAERFLTKSASYSENAPLDPDSSKIMVYCHEDKPIGFVAYDKQSFYKGRLRFIAIDERYRGKGYSEKLMNYALEDMKKMGSTVVQLLTRINNEAAQKLYKRLNFKLLWEGNGFVRFEKELNAVPA
jgi:ribosomal protein S18 acetylase RimI-like enzyme